MIPQTEKFKPLVRMKALQKLFATERPQGPLANPVRRFLHRIGKGLQPGSPGQKQIDLVEKPGSGGFVFQEEVIPPGKRYETSTGDSSRHLTARIDRDDKIVAHMQDERRHLHLWEQLSHIQISHGLKVANRAFR